MTHRTLIGNLFTGLSAGTVGTVLQDFCTACSKGDKVAIATVLGGLTGGPLLAVGLLAGGVGLQVWGQSREAKKQRERYAELAAKIAACKGDTRQLIDLVEPIADRSEFVQARLPGYEKADLAEWVAREVKKTLAPLLPDDAKPIDWDVLRIYIESNKAILDGLRAIATETRDNTAEALDILKTGRVRLPGIPEGVQNNLALAGIRPNADFEGRRDLIERVHEALSQSQTAALAHALSAEGGVGKTEIAIAYVFDAEYAEQWDGVWWLDASTGALDGSLATTLDALGYQRQKGDDAEALRRKLVGKLGDGRHLVILDNVDHRSTLESFAVGPNTRVLATTRLAPERIPPNVAQAIPVDLLDEAEATAVLLKHRKDLLDPESGTIAAEHAGAVAGILEELDGHALAVALCAAALRTDAGLSPAALLEQLRANELEAEGHALEHVEADATGRKYGLKVAASLLLLLPGVEAKHPLAARLLLAASLVHPSKIPFSLLVAATESDEAEARRATLALRDRSIVRFEANAGVEDKGLVSVHRLTQSAVRSRSGDSRIIEMSACVAKALLPIFPSLVQPTQWLAQDEALTHAVSVLERDFEDASLASALLVNTSHYLYTRARWPEADWLGTRALELQSQDLTEDHNALAQCMSNLGAIRQAVGKLSEAESLLQEALDMRRRLFDYDDPALMISISNLASIQRAIGRTLDAEPLFAEALDMARRLYDVDHSYVVTLLGNLGLVRLDLNLAPEAEVLFAESLDMSRRLFPDDHPTVAISLNNLAGAREQLGRLGEAYTLFLDALSMRRRLYQSDSPYVAESLNNLGMNLANQHQADQGLPLLQEACTMGRRCLPSGHPWLRIWEANLAAIRKHVEGP